MSDSFSQAQGMLNSVSTVGYVLKSWTDRIHTDDPELPIVYDEDIDYRTGRKQVDKKETFKESSSLKDMPFLAYSRSVLTYDDLNGTNLKSRTTRITCGTEGGENLVFKAIQGTFNINFIYYSRNLRDIERFEIAYLTEEFVSNAKRVEVNFPGPPDLKNTYTFAYDLLDEKIIRTETERIKGIAGTLRVSGLFFNLLGVFKQIKQIGYSLGEFDSVGPDGEILGKVNLDSINIGEL